MVAQAPARAGLLLALAVSACATPPPVDADIARAISQADVQGRLRLLEEQDERISGQRFVGGNRVDLLRNGPATYAAMNRAIAPARQRDRPGKLHVRPQDGRPVRRSAAGQARAKGSTVNLVYDAWGSMDTPAALFRSCARAACMCWNSIRCSPNPRVPLDLNRRDHRKLLVVDGAVAITGGVNISRVYENRPPPPGAPATADTLPWRDTDVRISGPAVAQFQRLFMATWHEQHGPPIAPPVRSPGWIRGRGAGGGDRRHPRQGSSGNLPHPARRDRTGAHSVHLTTGFFAPTPALRHGLERAARRGVDVRVIVPDHSTSALAIAAGRAGYGDLLEAGVHIMERHGVVLHAKTAVIDGDYSIVGSSNLDWRSVVYNNEIDAVVIDRAFGREMEALFRQDEAHSTAIPCGPGGHARWANGWTNGSPG